MEGKGVDQLSLAVMDDRTRGQGSEYWASSLTLRQDFSRIAGGLTDKRAQQALLSVIRYG